MTIKKKTNRHTVNKVHGEGGSIDRIKNEFITLASHQLRTPLSVVNWYTEMLLSGDVGKLTTEQKSYLQEIYHSSQQMVSLVNSLLYISRLEMGAQAEEPTMTDIRKMVNDVIDDQSLIIKKKKLHFEKTTHYSSGEMMIDNKQFKVVLQNLLKNAVKYTPDFGKIFLTIQSDRNKIYLVVKDAGIGIPKHQQSRVFSKFFRADNAKIMDTEGTGLGLYIVKSIVNSFGGKVWFESEENKGTTFHVTIPLVSPPIKGRA